MTTTGRLLSFPDLLALLASDRQLRKDTRATTNLPPPLRRGHFFEDHYARGYVWADNNHWALVPGGLAATDREQARRDRQERLYGAPVPDEMRAAVALNAEINGYTEEVSR